MEHVAALADRYSFGMVRVTHNQNLLLADVRQSDLQGLWKELAAQGLAFPNIGTLTDMIACPGGDVCALANARSIPIAQRISDRLAARQDAIGDLKIKISGCINACGHHHVGHIGILGVDKNGAEWYQVAIGGRQGSDAALGQVIGPSFAAADMPEVVAKLVATYLDARHPDERFVDTVHRIGIAPFKARVYGSREMAHAA